MTAASLGPRRVLPWRRVFSGWLMLAALTVTELASWGALIYTFSMLVVRCAPNSGWQARWRRR